MEKKFMSFKDMEVLYEKSPKPQYLWNGITEKSFGLVFGPSKSGKTIFCENLAMNLAIGVKEYFDYTLDGEPKKVLFIGLEEFWKNRMDRNKKQFSSLNENEKKLVDENYMYQSIDFNQRIISDNDWNNLVLAIEDSEAEVVFIDSITRMNSGKLEDSSTAEQIMQKLRTICHKMEVTLICVHHTHKMYNTAIDIDSIKGSSTFAQEADFAIGINRTTNNNRYMKNVFFRYAADEFETVKEFSIDSDILINFEGESEEEEVLVRTDKRRNNDAREQIAEYINGNSSQTRTTEELVTYFVNDTSLRLKERQIKTYLTQCSDSGEIQRIKRGVYASKKYNEEELQK